MAWSDPSRRRLLRCLASIDWASKSDLLFVGLTYPADFPSDGRLVKRHLRILRARMERKFGKLLVLWKLEFQDRGAPHMHMIVQCPGEVQALRAWFAQAWYEIVGSGDVRHLHAGTSLSPVRDWRAVPAYISGYIAGPKALAKARQNVVPAGFGAVGRWWGVWNCTEKWDVVAVRREEWMRARRVVRRLSGHGGPCVRSLWVMSREGGTNDQLWRFILQSPLS